MKTSILLDTMQSITGPPQLLRAAATLGVLSAEILEKRSRCGRGSHKLVLCASTYKMFVVQEEH